MAPKKRATKQQASAGKKRAKKRRNSGSKASGGWFKALCRRTAIALALLTLAIGLCYYFGSYPIRGVMTQTAGSGLNALRSALPWPAFIESGFNAVYDAIPHSEGLIVDGGELGHDESPLLAGVPTSQQPLRILHNKSCVNIFSPTRRSSVCLAYRLSAQGDNRATVPKQEAFDDPRVPQLSASQLNSGQWRAHPLVAPQLLASDFGQTGSNEAMLSTQLVPMRSEFATGIWQSLCQELFQNYPRRFGEIWIYAGPIFTKDARLLPSGLKVPSRYYAIAFDLTDAGGLRAISFIIPDAANHQALEHYISSIGAIEAATGLNLTPDMVFDARETLSDWVSPGLW